MQLIRHTKNKGSKVLTVAIAIYIATLGLPAHASVVAGHSNTTSLSSGLVGYWSLDGATTNWLTDTTQDKSGNGNTGSLVNMSTTTSPTIGKIGQALKFNGTTSYIDMGTPASLVSSNEETFAFWYKTPTNSGGQRILGKFGSTELEMETSNTAMCLTVFPSVAHCSSAGFIPTSSLNQWIFVVGIFDHANSQVLLYKNGTLFQTLASSDTLVPGATHFTLANSGAGPLQGSLDDVRVYNRVLSAQEVAQLYTLGTTNVAHSNTVSLSSGLVGYWPFDGNTTNWLTSKTSDSSGNGNTGLLVGMSTTTSPVIGKIGQALNFNGTTSYVSVSPFTSLAAGSAYSISVWAKPSIKQTNTFPEFAAGGAVQLGFQSNGGTLFYASGSFFATTYTPDNKWHLFTYVYTGTTLNLFVDGVFKESVVTNSPVINSLIIGWGGGANTVYTGVLDDVRVYKRALSAQEVQQLYAQGQVNVAHSNTTSISSGLVGYWTFDGPKINWATGVTTDSSGSGNMGQLVNLSTSTAPVIGKLGQGLNFTLPIGSNYQYVNLPSGLIQNNTSITTSLWFKTSTSGGIMGYQNQSVGTAPSAYVPALYVGVDGKLRGEYYQGAVNPITSAGIVTDGKWHQVVLAGNVSTQSMYLDGAVIGTLSGTIVNNLGMNFNQIGVANIGGTWPSGNGSFVGSIDDVRVYNRALSAQEVAQLYASTK